MGYSLPTVGFLPVGLSPGGDSLVGHLPVGHSPAHYGPTSVLAGIAVVQSIDS